LYIFDINVPDGDGIVLLQELRDFHDTKYLKSAFEVGANDFIKKHFGLKILCN